MWPKGPTIWLKGENRYISIPFTWNLPKVKACLQQEDFWSNDAGTIVGGPAVMLMPDYFDDLTWVDSTMKHLPGILQKVNSQATRTTLGCPNRCEFCGIGEQLIEPGPLVELDDWPDRPIICDNNLLAARMPHFERVIERLMKHDECDFNQGLDVRLLTDAHCELLGKLPNPKIRIALDPFTDREVWRRGVARLRHFKVRAHDISSYVLIGFADTPEEAWSRCNYVKEHRVKLLPMWHHKLDELNWNTIRPDQRETGWTQEQRTKIMGYFWRRRGKPPITEDVAQLSEEKPCI